MMQLCAGANLGRTPTGLLFPLLQKQLKTTGQFALCRVEKSTIKVIRFLNGLFLRIKTVPKNNFLEVQHIPPSRCLECDGMLLK